VQNFAEVEKSCARGLFFAARHKIEDPFLAALGMTTKDKIREKKKKKKDRRKNTRD
jgi:hypothetical protein